MGIEGKKDILLQTAAFGCGYFVGGTVLKLVGVTSAPWLPIMVKALIITSIYGLLRLVNSTIERKWQSDS